MGVVIAFLLLSFILMLCHAAASPDDKDRKGLTQAEKDFGYAFVIAAAGVSLVLLSERFIGNEATGVLAFLFVPMIIQLLTQLPKKTFFSSRTISLLCMTYISTIGIYLLIVLYLVMTGKLH